MGKKIKMSAYQPADNATPNNDERLNNAEQLKNQMVGLMSDDEREMYADCYTATAEVIDKICNLVGKSIDLSEEEFRLLLGAGNYFINLAKVIIGDEVSQEE